MASTTEALIHCVDEQKAQRIYDFYGESNQLEKTLEELDELKEAVAALLKLNRSYLPKNSITYKGQREYMIDHIAEEIADVEIMTIQLRLGLNIARRTKDWATMKVDRQLDRMELEK